jgi:hypothetical protein
MFNYVLKLVTKRLDEAKCWKLWWLLKSHDGIVYDIETKSLHIFGVPAYSHMVRRPIEPNYHTAGLWVFNDTEEDHRLEVTTTVRSVYFLPFSFGMGHGDAYSVPRGAALARTYR